MFLAFSVIIVIFGEGRGLRCSNTITKRRCMASASVILSNPSRRFSNFRIPNLLHREEGVRPPRCRCYSIKPPPAKQLAAARSGLCYPCRLRRATWSPLIGAARWPHGSSRRPSLATTLLLAPLLLGRTSCAASASSRTPRSCHP